MKKIAMLAFLALLSTAAAADGLGPYFSGKQLPIHVGVGAAPNAWGSTFKSLELQAGALSSNSNINTYLTANLYNDGSTWRYRSAGSGSVLQVGGASLRFKWAPTGSAGGAATISQIFSLTSTGAVELSGALSSTKTCATGYTRKGANYCKGQAVDSPYAGVGYTGLTRDACTAISAPATDADELDLTLYLAAQGTGGGAGARRTANVTVYSDSGCASILLARQVSAVEPSSGGAQVLAEAFTVAKVPLPTNGAAIYAKFTDDAGNVGSASYYADGYRD